MSTTRGQIRAECKHEYGMRPVRDARARGATMRRCSRWRTTSSASSAPQGVRRLCKKNHVLYDIKHVFPAGPTVDWTA